ncbi:MAG: chemotaxis protein CheW [Deltaproteobacteria bacterium]|nr:chemotaxis protein CheW [Deltaproteobacteria bacterium]
MSDLSVAGVSELRRAFDASFAAAPASASEDTADLLALRLAGDAHAVRLEELTGLVRVPKLLPVPARAPAFLGLVGLRGLLVPVFSLAEVLGYPAPREVPRWMLLCGKSEPLGLAFDDFEAFLRLPLSAITRLAPGAQRPCVLEVVQARDEAKSIIDLARVLATLRVTPSS